MTGKNALTAYKTIEIEVNKAWQVEGTHILETNRNEPWVSKTSRNALTHYETVKIKAQQVEMNSPTIKEWK